MLISEFARMSDLSVDTVRFYIKQGLLQPQQGLKGGSRPYQIFSHADLETAHVIRVGRALGLSLAEIGAFIQDIGIEGVGEEGSDSSDLLTFLACQRDGLLRKIADLEALAGYLEAKMAWLKDPVRTEAPTFPNLG